LTVGRPISFVDGSDAERFLGNGWSGLEPTGVWTIGNSATIIFELPVDVGNDLDLVLGSHAFVTPAHPELTVVFTSRAERLETRFRDAMRRRVLRIPLARVIDTQRRVVVNIEIDQPASPRELGLSDDSRLLGLRLEWLIVGRTGVRGRWDTIQRRLRRADRGLIARATDATRKSAKALAPRH
jgi:hypothetical protein